MCERMKSAQPDLFAAFGSRCDTEMAEDVTNRLIRNGIA